MRPAVLILFAVVATFASIQQAEATSLEEDYEFDENLADKSASFEHNNRRSHNTDASLDEVDEFEFSNEDAEHRRKGSKDDSSSAESSSAEESRPRRTEIPKKAPREELEKFVGKFVIDYLISRLRSAKKRLVESLVDKNGDGVDI